MGPVTPKSKRTVLRATGGLLVFVALAEWLLWLMPPPHRPLQYMIAGTAATAAALGLLFALVVTQKISLAELGYTKRLTPQRIVRGSAPPS
jgi:hypothetical protein